MRIVLLEDEAPARARLEQALGRVAPEASVIAALASVDEAVRWFTTAPAPDLVLADVQLADGLSLELFKQVEVACPVVFCTAYDEYMVQALALGGIDYLLKPVRDTDLARVLGKVRRLESHFAERLRSVATALGRRGPRRILARHRRGIVALAVEQVAYFVVRDKLVDVVTREGETYAVDRTLGEIQAELDADAFFRVNRQYLVHASAVLGFQPSTKGKLLVALTPPADEEVVVSQENGAAFRDWLRG